MKPPTLPNDRTDWERLRNMTDEEALANAEADPDAQPLTDEQLEEMQPGTVVLRLRLALKLTQKDFAERFHLSLSVVRDWEQLRSKPSLAAQALLCAIEDNPQGVARALKNHHPYTTHTPKNLSILDQLTDISKQATLRGTPTDFSTQLTDLDLIHRRHKDTTTQKTPQEDPSNPSPTPKTTQKTPKVAN